jgi:hypothetical protein|tara:strand:+ start:381 stop:656 length:276 start_codon:yes stop_codon:yes gene_type:complete
MYHLQPGAPRPDIAKTPDARTLHQELLLRPIEVKKTQRDRTCTVGDSTKQGTTATKSNLGELDLTFHQNFCAWAKSAQWLELRPVLVTDWQ